ncbi:hypothetical protein [Arthrobacter sp. NPDC089319]|uniref:hypothetical protein n=1 Tax=Arthrobacter sp. NPDC089319 TaxID=3155915 RepID=UPI0034381538
MYVEVSRSGGAAVKDLENLRELAVRAGGGLVEQDVAHALAAAGLGTVDAGYAWLEMEQLRAGGAAQPPQWAEGFDGMISFAKSRGWLSDDGGSVRAHIDYRE